MTEQSPSPSQHQDILEGDLTTPHDLHVLHLSTQRNLGRSHFSNVWK